MIGQFRYSEQPCAKHVVVWMEWVDGLPSARVEAPGHVASQLDELKFNHIEGSMGLEFALGYGVIIAAVAKAKLTLSGDLSAWPAEWGELRQRSSITKLPPESPVH